MRVLTKGVRLGRFQGTARWFVAFLVMAGMALVGASASVAGPAQAAPTVVAEEDSGSAVTVAAPGAGSDATVTVSQTTNMVNQTVRVSWTGFRPSSDTRLQNAGDAIDINTERPVRVYECRGTDPASSSDCYGSPGFRGIDATDSQPAVPAVPPFTYHGQTNAYDSTPDGPANWQDNVTRADGTGEVAIQVFTKRESAALACNVDNPCSIVVVPNYGRPSGDTEDKLDAPYAWARRTVVPLSFLSVGDACPLAGTALRVEGSPMAALTLASWRAKTCVLSSDPVDLDYTAIGEPQTRGDVSSGTTDTGLVINPLSAADAASAGAVYAPVAATSLVVAFQIDDADGKPITHLNLNARLVAKLITGSYRSGGDDAVANNPVNIFNDPELQALNPGVSFPSGAPGNHPLILGDLSDVTGALTSWIASDPDAVAFLNGTPDPWGMTVNTNYKNISLPFSTFPLLDQKLSDTYAPIQGLDALARQLSIAQFPGSTTVVEDGRNVAIKPPRQNPGRREVIGIIDAPSAARFDLPTASLQNHAGAFVAPTNASILDGIEHSTVNTDGVTRSVNFNDSDTGIYPLSLLVSGAFSTKASSSERQEMADFISYAAGAGQVQGNEAGELPVGNAPLSSDLVALDAKARQAVLDGYQAPPSASAAADSSGSGSGLSSATPSASLSPSPSVSPSATASASASPTTGSSSGGLTGGNPSSLPVAPGDPSAAASAAPSAAPESTSSPALVTVSSQLAHGRLIWLPALGILLLLALAGGPLLLWMSQTGRGPTWLRR